MIFSLGTVRVDSAGTPVRVTLNQPDPTKRYPANAVLIQPLKWNKGRIYVGRAGMNKALLGLAGANGVVAVIPKATASVYASFAAADQRAPVGLNLADLYIDADGDHEGAVISGLIS